MHSFSRIILLLTLAIGQITALKAQQIIRIKAKSGDGIHKILQAYKMDTPIYYQEFIRLNQSKLIKKNQLVIGRVYTLPKKNEKPKATYYPIFGEKYGHIARESSQLKGAIYYLVSGHGGPDPGAVGERNGHRLTEDEYAYDICLRLGRELIRQGATVYIIVRDSKDGIRDEAYLKNSKDETVWKGKKIPLNTNKKLRQRTYAVNQLYRKNRGRYQRLLVLHIDSRSVKERVDVFGYYNSKSNKGKLFAERILKSLKDNYKKSQPNRSFKGQTMSRNGLYMVKYTHPITAYFELGNLQNPKDQVRFIKSSNRQAIAEWISQGCLIDFAQKK
jgi:N-acetylmuramoyl-L-alanine amidase